jgi:bacterioferritin-associated ferredoxin
MYVCICNAITERQVRECVRSGASSVEELAITLGVGAGCGRCRDCAAGLLQELQCSRPDKKEKATVARETDLVRLCAEGA